MTDVWKKQRMSESLFHPTRGTSDDLWDCVSIISSVWERDTDPQNQGGGDSAVADTLSRGQEVTPACEKALVLWNALHWRERHTRIHMATQLNAKKACKSIYNRIKKRKSSQERDEYWNVDKERGRERQCVWSTLLWAEHDLVQTVYSISTYATQNINKPLLKS